MPDTSAATPNDIPTRVAVLEEIARHTAAALADIRSEIRGIREDMRDMRHEIRDGRNRMDRYFLWLLGLYIAGFASLLGVMARGFHWL